MLSRSHRSHISAYILYNIYKHGSKEEGSQRKVFCSSENSAEEEDTLAFPEPPPQLDPVDVEDTEHTELEDDIVASERDSTTSRGDALDDGAATATTTPAVSQDYRNK